MFAHGQNCLMTHFSECIPVINQLLTVQFYATKEKYRVLEGLTSKFSFIGVGVMKKS